MDWSIIAKLNKIMPYDEVYYVLSKWGHSPDDSRHDPQVHLNK